MTTEALRVFVVSPPGLEQLVAAELNELGITGTVENGGVEWTGWLADVRTSNLWLRTASRVLVRVGEFRARTFFELERLSARMPWAKFLSADRAVTLRVTARKSKLYHEGAIAERLFRAIAETAGARAHMAGSEEQDGEHAQLFVVRVLRDNFTISADASGALLHRRGYRQEIGKAPLRETLAAALLRAAHWTGQAPLLDPFCGSGTIPIEAALLARNVAPGLAGAARQARAYAFEHWPQHDEQQWLSEVARARTQIRGKVSVPILASDRDGGAVRTARANAARAGVESDIEWAVAPLSQAPLPAAAGLLVTNPPYGQRVSADTELRDLYAALGTLVREKLTTWSVAMLSADARLDGQMRLPLTVVAETRNGGIPVRIVTHA
ncbi:MAG: THUMP domain-containing class I SAM-dependent RNA methyltransferase [Longimicrobiales bacterium]